MGNRFFGVTFLWMQFVGAPLCFAQTSVSNATDSLLLLESEVRAQTLSDDQLLGYLEKARDLQETTDKNHGRSFLEAIEGKMNGRANDRIQFLYYLLKSDNTLFYHDYSSSLSHSERAFEYIAAAKAEERAGLYSTIGTCHYYTSDYVAALEMHQKALQICEAISEADCLARVYNNIGVVYIGAGEWLNAEKYILQALDVLETTSNDPEKSRAIGNMAILFAEKGQFEKSEEWFKRDLHFDLSRGDSLSAARNYNNLGRLKDMQQLFGEALHYYTRGLELAKSQQDEASVAIGHQNVGWMQHKIGNQAQALANFQLGMGMARQLGNRDKLRDALLNISEIYEELDQPALALRYFQEYHALNDSLVGEQNLNALSELEIKYDTERKENQILRLSDERLSREEALKAENRKVRALSIGLVALSIISALSFFLFRQRLRNRKQNELILAISETQTAERKRISQDLHDSIGGSLAMTRRKLRSARGRLEGASPEIDEALVALDDTRDQVRQISHNLMPGELVRFGLVPAINTLLEQLDEEELRAQLYTTRMEDRLKPMKEIQLYRIIQEAIQNVLKHAQAKNLYIHLHRHKHFVSLLIEDDGIGIDPHFKEGLGFRNIEQRVQLLKGSFALDSSEKNGTTLNIKIPI